MLEVGASYRLTAQSKPRSSCGLFNIIFFIFVFAYKILNYMELLDILSGEVVSSLGLLPMAVGFLAAFASGCLACKFMINIVRRQKLIYFAIYCLCAGIFSIVYELC